MDIIAIFILSIYKLTSQQQNMLVESLLTPSLTGFDIAMPTFTQIINVYSIGINLYTLYLILIFLLILFCIFYLFVNQLAIKLWIKSVKEHLGIQYPTIRKLIKAKLPAEIFIKTLIECEHKDIPMNLEDVEFFYLKNINLRNFIKNSTKAQEPDTYINLLYLKKVYKTNDNAQKLADIAFECMDEDLDLSFENIVHLSSQPIKIEKLIFSHKQLLINDIELDIPGMLDDQYLTSSDVAQIILGSHKSMVQKLDIDSADLISHAYVKGNVEKVVKAYSLVKDKIEGITFNHVADIDLSGYDVEDAVKNALNTQIIKIEDIRGVSKDRFTISTIAKLTVRTDLNNLITGAKEDTLVTRAKEAIIAAIGTYETYEDFVQNPSRASDIVLKKEIDKSTCYKLISVNIVDFDPGHEIDTDLRILRAEYEKIIVKADSERRKLLAEVSAQEARVEIKRAEARIKQAEAKVREAEAKLKEIDAKTRRNAVLDNPTTKK